MKKLFVILLAAVLAAPVSAKSLRQLWIDMPDSILPYFNKNLRMEFVDFLDMKVKAEVKNLLGGNCHMDTLTADYLHVALNESADLEIKLLPCTDGDSILCWVKTLKGPEKESELCFYDQGWNHLDTKQMMGGLTVSDINKTLIHKPDTITESRYEELKDMIEPEITGFSLSMSENTITAKLSLPLLAEDDKKAVNAILMQRKFKWSGKFFK